MVIPGEAAHFQPLERETLTLLHRRMPTPVSRDAIIENLYSTKPECDWPENEIALVKVVICKIRKKLKAHRIVNERAVGYRLEKLPG